MNLNSIQKSRLLSAGCCGCTFACEANESMDRLGGPTQYYDMQGRSYGGGQVGSLAPVPRALLYWWWGPYLDFGRPNVGVQCMFFHGALCANVAPLRIWMT